MNDVFSPPMVEPKEWFHVSRAFAEMVFCMVTFTVGFFSLGLPLFMSYMWR